jgi:hypothetical protein
MNRFPQKTYSWRPGRHGESWKGVTRRVGPEGANLWLDSRLVGKRAGDRHSALSALRHDQTALAGLNRKRNTAG